MVIDKLMRSTSALSHLLLIRWNEKRVLVPQRSPLQRDASINLNSGSISCCNSILIAVFWLLIK